MLVMAAPLFLTTPTRLGPSRGDVPKAAVDFALVGLREASHGGDLLALRKEGKAACLQRFGVSVRRDGGGQIVQCGP